MQGFNQILLFLIMASPGTANPNRITREGFYVTGNLTGSLRTMSILCDMGPSSLKVSALAKHLSSVRKCVFNKSMIKNLGKLSISPHSHFTSPHTVRFDRIHPFYPATCIQVVYMLLTNLITGCPGKMIPIVHLILHLGHAWLFPAVPNRITIPIHTKHINISNHPILELFDAINIAFFMPTLQSYTHGKTFFFCFLRGGQYATNSSHITSNWLLHKYFFSLVYRVFKLLRLEAWRCGNYDHVNIFIDRLLVSV